MGIRIDGLIERQTDEWESWKADRQTYEQMGTPTHRRIYRQAGRRAVRYADRHTDRMMDIRTDTENWKIKVNLNKITKSIQNFQL